MGKPAKETVARDERRPVSLRAYVLSDTRDCDAVVSDLSYSGCQIETDAKLETGEQFELRVVKLGAIPVEVKWSNHGRAGAQFLG
ncbi:MAG TPA: PilZ domain-containing protein [Sphingomicrobium sp.]|jgi:hypothetical protein